MVSLVFLLVFVVSPLGFAQRIGWNENLSLVVGETYSQGIDMHHQGDNKSIVAVMDTKGNITDHGAATVDIAFAQNKFDLVKSFSLNSCMAAKSLVGHGSVGLNIVDNLSDSQNTLHFAYVCKRDVGTTRYRPLDGSDELKDFVAKRKGTMSAADLRNAVAEKYGTYFVTGVQKVIRVAVVYSFQFESQAIAQSYSLTWRGKYGSGVSGVAFNGTVASMLAQTNTHVAMSYRLDTTDSSAPWPILSQGSITNFEQFLTINTMLETYSQNLSENRPQPASYVVAPDTNIPHYDDLFENAGTSTELTDYDRFLEVYAKFKNWENLLMGWTEDARRMSWLNADGQRMVIEMRKDVTAYRKYLEQLAQAHFQNGKPLEVSDALMNYMVSLNHIPLPSVNIALRISSTVGTAPGTAESYWFGYVDAGPQNLTIDHPFPILSILSGGIEVPPDGSTLNPVTIYWDTNDFVALLNSPANLTTADNARRFFAPSVGDNPQLGQLFTMAKTRRLGFFLVLGSSHYYGQYENWMLGIRDATGDFADLWRINVSRATPALQNLEGSSRVALDASVEDTPSSAVVGAGSDVVIGVTNAGPGAAYGVTVTMTIGPGFEVAAVVGSQGYGTVTNEQLNYLVGSLANGSQACIRLRLVPLEEGELRIGNQMLSAVGPGLMNLTTPDSVTLGLISAQSPRLILSRAVGTPKVTWTSESSRLVLEQTPRLTGSQVWVQVLDGIDSNGSVKELALPTASPSSFYRLRVK